MVITIATLFGFVFAGSTVDIVAGTNIVETVERYVCVSTMDAKWINLHTPQAKCVGGTWEKPDTKD